MVSLSKVAKYFLITIIRVSDKNKEQFLIKIKPVDE